LPFYLESVPAPHYFSGVFFPLAGSSIIALANYAGVLAYFPKEEGITSRRSFSFQRTSEELSKNLYYPPYTPSRITG